MKTYYYISDTYSYRWCDNLDVNTYVKYYKICNYYHIISLSKISKLLYIMEFKDFLIKYTTISKNFIEDGHNREVIILTPEATKKFDCS